MALKGGVGVAEVLVAALEVGIIVAEVEVVELEVVATALEAVVSAVDVGAVVAEADVAREVVVIALEVGDITLEAVVIVPKVEVGVSEVGVGLGGGGVQDTPAASLSKQKRMNPDGHSSRLFSLPVHSQSLTQIFPAPSPKRSAASV